MSEYTTTPNYGLLKPDVDADEDLWGEHLNQNQDTLDALIKSVEDAQAEYLRLTGGELLGSLQLPNGTLAAPALQIGAADGTGISRSVNALVAGVQGSIVLALFANSAQFYTPLSLLNNRISLVADPTAAADALNLRTGDARYMSAGAGPYLPLAGGLLSGPVTIRYAASDYDGQLYLRPTDGTSGAEAQLRLGGTFPNSGDTAVRFVSSIRSGFVALDWAAGYTDVWIANQTNDVNSDRNQARIARFSLAGLDVTGLSVSGETLLGNGLHFAEQVPPSPSDLSKHIDLYGGQYGFSVTAYRLNIVTTGASSLYVAFVNNGGDVATVSATGLTMVGLTDITLARDPSADMHAANRGYVNGGLNTRVAKTGDQMSGGLDFGQRFAASPTDLTQHISLYSGWGGLSVTGGALNIVAGGLVNLQLSGAEMLCVVPMKLGRDPQADNECATKRYVDSHTGGVGYLPTSGGILTGTLAMGVAAPAAAKARTIQTEMLVLPYNNGGIGSNVYVDNVGGGAWKSLANGAGWSMINGATDTWQLSTWNTSTAGATVAPVGRLTFDGRGNLAMGILAPQLQALGNGVNGGWLFGWGATLNNWAQNVYYDGTTWRYLTAAAASQTQQAGGAWQWQNAPSGAKDAAVTLTQRMALDAAGNLSVTGNLSASVITAASQYIIGASGAYFYSDANVTQIQWDTGAWLLQYVRATGTLRYLRGSDSAAMFQIDGAGNTTQPGSGSVGGRLTVGEIMNTSGVFRVASNDAYYFNRAGDGTWQFVENGTAIFRVAPNGTTYLGQTHVQNTLLVSTAIIGDEWTFYGDGNGRAIQYTSGGWKHFWAASSGDYMYYNNAGTPLYWATASGGNLNVWGAVNPNQGSDDRLKRDVEPYTRGLADLVKLRPIKFVFNGRGTTTDGEARIGLSAQASRAHIPELVYETPEPPHDPTRPRGPDFTLPGQLSLDDRPLIFAAINAIRELSEMNAALVARVIQLEQQRMH